MGLFDGWFPSSDEDESLIEISNDEGDHWVVSTPTEETEGVLGWLFGASVEEDDDERYRWNYDKGRRAVERRDSHQYRAHSERVVDEYEDNEDTYDRENDRSDYEDSHDREADFCDREEDEQEAEHWWQWW